MAPLTPHRVLIPPRDPRPREERLDLLLDSLGARSEIVQSAVTVRAALPRQLAVVAAVAEEAPTVLMVDKRYFAIGTIERIPAGTANHDSRRTSPVEEEDRLLVGRHGTLDQLLQRLADDRGMSPVQLEAHIDH